jgi:hypothetical protein
MLLYICVMYICAVLLCIHLSLLLDPAASSTPLWVESPSDLFSLEFASLLLKPLSLRFHLPFFSLSLVFFGHSVFLSFSYYSVIFRDFLISLHSFSFCFYSNLFLRFISFLAFFTSLLLSISFFLSCYLSSFLLLPLSSVLTFPFLPLFIADYSFFSYLCTTLFSFHLLQFFQ